jgi:hypothetical protein
MARKEALLDKLLAFFTPDLVRVLCDVIGGRQCVSLRLLDWFVTSYARRHSSSFVFRGKTVIVWNEYKSMLKSYSKTHFDPFCRRDRIHIDASGGSCVLVVGSAESNGANGAAGPNGANGTGGAAASPTAPTAPTALALTTTIGQLNFFRWAIESGLLVYVQLIERDVAHDLATHTHKVKAGSTSDAHVHHGYTRVASNTTVAFE